MHGTVISVVAYNSDLTKEGTPFDQSGTVAPSLEDLHSQYQGWEEELQVLVKVRKQPRTFRCALLETHSNCVPVCEGGSAQMASTSAQATSVLCPRKRGADGRCGERVYFRSAHLDECE